MDVIGVVTACEVEKMFFNYCQCYLRRMANETFQDVSRALFLEEILCSRYPMAGSCNMCNFGLRQFHHHRSSLS